MQVYVERLCRKGIDVHRRYIVRLLIRLLFFLPETLQELHPLQRVQLCVNNKRKRGWIRATKKKKKERINNRNNRYIYLYIRIYVHDGKRAKKRNLCVDENGRERIFACVYKSNKLAILPRWMFTLRRDKLLHNNPKKSARRNFSFFFSFPTEKRAFN